MKPQLISLLMRDEKFPFRGSAKSMLKKACGDEKHLAVQSYKSRDSILCITFCIRLLPVQTRANK
jgi:hypothetical protein